MRLCEAGSFAPTSEFVLAAHDYIEAGMPEIVAISLGLGS